MTTTTRTEARPVSKIAREIVAAWHPVNYAAKPYLDAMLQLDSVSDNYGYDSARSVIRYFLCNAKSWRGDDARRIKAELNAMLKAK